MAQRYLLFLLCLVHCLWVLGKPVPPPRVSEPAVYSGACGASAAAAVQGDLLVVADDEANQLRVFRRDQGGPALQVIDLTADLELDRHAPETDIEGAARIGDRVYWITSHSRNHLGKAHPNRCRLFATTIQATNSTVKISFVGRPYKDLLSDLISASSLRAFGLAEASRRSPKVQGGLNIEGLCATPDNQLLIGFRSPIPGGKALLVPLENPREVIEGKKARFGPPLQLDLNGLGIRDMAYWDGHYMIIAGPDEGGGKSKLFSWSGGASNPRHLKEIDLKGLNPEAIIVYPDKGWGDIQLLSDDSSRQGKDCSDLGPDARHFRSVWVRPELRHIR